jgi:TP901 family phage tail tape measure protein
MAVRTAQVVYVGDAASLIRASQEAAAATEGATAKIEGANARYMASATAAGEVAAKSAAQTKLSADAQAAAAGDAAKRQAAAVGASAKQQEAAYARAADAATASAIRADAAAGTHINAAGKVKSAFHSLAGSFGLQLGAAGLVAAAVESDKLAVSFQKAMTEIQTQAGASASEVKKMSSAVENLKGVQQGPLDLAKALFQIESVGFRGAEALKALGAASNVAAVGNANIVTTAGSLVSVLKSYHLTATDATHITADMNAVVGAGRMHMEDLVNAMATGIIPTAAAAGISFKSLGAGIDTLTIGGFTAERAATLLRTALFKMAAPTTAATKALTEIHLTHDSLAAAMRSPRGLVAGVELLASHMQGLSKIQQVDLLSKVFSSRSAAVIVTLEGNLGTLRSRLKTIDDQAKGSTFAQAISTQANTSAGKIAKATVEIEKDALKMGKSLPPLEAAFTTGFASILGVVVTVPQKIKTALQGPVFDWLVHTSAQVLHDVVSTFKGGFTTLEGVVQVFAGVFTLNSKQAWQGVEHIFSGGAKALVAILDGMTAPFQGAAKAAFHAIVTAAQSAFNDLYNAGKYVVDGLVKGIESAAGSVASVAKKIAKLPGEAIHEVLGIKSASKVMHQYGEWTAEGFANGLAAGKAKVTAGLSDGLLSPVHSAMAHIASVGGFSAASGTNYSKGLEPQIAKDLDALGKALHIRLTGISGYRTPQHSVEVGGYANDPHTRGEASDTEGAQNIAEKVLEKFGLTRPFGGAKEANHIQLLAGHAAATVHTVASRSGKLNRATLEALWIEAGGSPATAKIAASIALAESGGSVGSKGDVGMGGSGPTSFGLWQVHTPAHPQYSASKLASDPLYNARAAVAIASGGFGPWTTYKTGAYKPFMSGPGGSVMGATGGTLGPVAPEPKFTLTAVQAAQIARLTAGASGAHGQVVGFGAEAAGVSSTMSALTARWGARPPNIATAAGAANKMGHDESIAWNDKARKRFEERELKALRKEVRNWSKIRDSYLRLARHAHGKGAKKEAIAKAAEFDGKVKQAQGEAKELQGTIYAAGTEIIEADAAVAKDPAEAAAAQAEAASGAYGAAIAKIDLEQRAQIISPEQAQAQKTALAQKALAGGFGPLSAEGVLQVKGDLIEFAKALEGATSAAEAHTQALLEATKAQLEQTQAAQKLAEVEQGSLVKAMADMISGQIAGVDYAGRRLTAGAGSAARY